MPVAKRRGSPPIVISPALSTGANAKAIRAACNELRAAIARAHNIPIGKVRLEVAVDECFH